MLKRRPELEEISVEELKLKLDRNEEIVIIDVREPDEYEICHLEDAKLIPIRQLPNQLKELNPNQPTVLYCHHGIRSAQAALWLAQNGFTHAMSLRGGIDEWALKIDSEMERY